jgi:hypothetical protein
MMQPVTPIPFMTIGMIALEVKKEAGRKELELLGHSSAACAAAGSGDYCVPMW